MKFDIRFILLLFICLPVSAVAEVSDKIASIPLMWGQAVIFGSVGFFLAYKKWWLSFIGIFLFLAMATGTYDMQSDKFMKIAVFKEQGEMYFKIGYISSVIVLLLTVFGAFYGHYRNAKKST